MKGQRTRFLILVPDIFSLIKDVGDNSELTGKIK